jgi:MFS family permease
VALAIFMAASIGCATASTLPGFVIWRFVQGLGGAMMTPVGRLVIVRGVPKDQLVTALSTLTIPSLVGPVIGPPLGGLSRRPIGAIFFVHRSAPRHRFTIFFVMKSMNKRRSTSRAFPLRCRAAGAIMARLFDVTCLRPQRPSDWFARWLRPPRAANRPALLNLRPDIPTYSAGVVGGAIFRIGAGASAFLVPLMLQLDWFLMP